MALTFTNSSSNNSIVLGATLALATNTASIGDMMIVCVAADNNGTNGVTSVSSVTDAAGNTYTLARDVTYDPGAAAAGATNAIFYSVLTAALSAQTITVNFSPNTLNKAAVVYRVQPASGFNVRFVSAGTGSTGNTTTPTITATGVVINQTIVGFLAAETDDVITADTDTTNGSWSAAYTALADGGADAVTMVAHAQYKTVTATGNQTYNTSTATARDIAINYVIVGETFPAQYFAQGCEDANWHIVEEYDRNYYHDLGTYTLDAAPPDHCVYPQIGSVISIDNASATNHTLTLPSGSQRGDLVYFHYYSIQSTTSVNKGFTLTDGTLDLTFIWKVLDGSEGSSITATLVGAADLNGVGVRIRAGSFDPSKGINLGPLLITTSNNPNSDSLTAPSAGFNYFFSIYTRWNASSLTAYPSNCPLGRTADSALGIAGHAAAHVNGATFDPGSFTTTGSFAWVAATGVIHGWCPPEDFILGDGAGLDDQDFTDFVRDTIGTSVDPPPTDLFVEPPLLGIGEGLDEQDFTDFADYSSQSDPLSEDAPPLPIYSDGLDDQDFTDFADYGSQTDQPIDDAPNFEICLAAEALDDQDFTDFADYGFTSDPPIDNAVASSIREVDWTRTFQVDGAGDFTIVYPSAIEIPVEDGDCWVLMCATRGPQTIVAPTGWTEVLQQATGDTSTTQGTAGIAVFVGFRANGVDPDTTFTRTSGDVTLWAISRVRGVDPVNPVNTSASTVSTSFGTSVTLTGGVTTTKDGCYLFAVGACGDNNNFGSLVYSTRGDLGSDAFGGVFDWSTTGTGADTCLGFYPATMQNAGNTGDLVATFTGSDDKNAVAIVALNPLNPQAITVNTSRWFLSAAAHGTGPYTAGLVDVFLPKNTLAVFVATYARTFAEIVDTSNDVSANATISDSFGLTWTRQVNIGNGGEVIVWTAPVGTSDVTTSFTLDHGADSIYTYTGQVHSVRNVDMQNPVVQTAVSGVGPATAPNDLPVTLAAPLSPGNLLLKSMAHYSGTLGWNVARSGTVSMGVETTYPDIWYDTTSADGTSANYSQSIWWFQARQAHTQVGFNIQNNAGGTTLTYIRAAAVEFRHANFDIILGQDEPEQDFTDFADYGTTSEPLVADVVVTQPFNDGLDYQDFSDLQDYGTETPPVGPDNECVYPEIDDVTSTVDAASGTSHTVDLPTGISSGQRLILIFANSGVANDYTIPSGYTPVTGTTSVQTVFAYRDCDGTEPSTINVTTLNSTTLGTHVVRLRAGTFNQLYAPEGVVVSNSNGTTYDPSSLTASWGFERALWFASGKGGFTGGGHDISSYPATYQDNQNSIVDAGGNRVYVFSTRTFAGSTDNPPVGTWDASSTNVAAGTLAVLGFCPTNQLSNENLDSQDFTDFEDYGFIQNALQEDVVVDQPFNDGLDDQDFSDLADYGGQTDQAIPDNDQGIQYASIALDDQDFTDFADYGSVVDEPIDDNNPEVCVEAVSLDTQDFTDFADYGFSSDPLSEDFIPPQDTLLGVELDSQDFTDFADYGFVTDEPIDDNNPEVCVAAIALDDQDFTDFTDYGTSWERFPPDTQDFNLGTGEGLDEQDFTDFADYGSSSDPLSADFVAPQDILLGIELDDQDFSDKSDYSFSSNPPIDDNNPEVCVEAIIALDTQDFTDFADYGFSSNPPIPDNNPEVAPSALDDQDFTDFADYGFSSEPAIDDNTSEVCVEAIALDTQDFTDFTDYGFSSNPPIPDNNPEVCVEAIIALDTQDFTDFTDYGFVTNQAIPDNDQNFRPDMVALDSQDFTDFADYGSQTDQAIDDNNPEVAPSALDDQDFTDFTDYGSSFDPLPDDFITPQDFNLGTGEGLDEQDFTDFADYGSASWLTPDDVTTIYATGIEAIFEIGCIHTVSWADIPDVPASWLEIANTNSSWSPIATAPNTWEEDC